MLSFECIKNEKSVYFLLTSAVRALVAHLLPYGKLFLSIIGQPAPLK